MRRLHGATLSDTASVVRANIFSRLTFSWMTPMMRLGKEKYITEEDLWALPRSALQDRRLQLTHAARIKLIS